MPQEVVLCLPAMRDPAAFDAAELHLEAARALRIALPRVREVRVQRISFDARPKHMQWRVAAEVFTTDEPAPPPLRHARPALTPPPPEALRVAVVGMGPAGMFAALVLARAGLQVTILERGKDVQARRRDVAALNHGEPADPDSNYAFGEGGAGTYSDGKLYTRSVKRGPVREVLETLVAHGAPETILVSWRPHVGSNRLPKVITALRETLQQGGVEVRFGARASVILCDAEGRACGLQLADGTTIGAAAVILATGHSALDAVRMAQAAGAAVEAKGFAMGVRVEHSQAWVDSRQYRGVREQAALPPAFYELAAQSGERGVYSFCMCPGGWIVPSQTDPAALLVNGMSLAKRDSPFANSGVVVEILPEDWCGRRGGRWGWPDLLRRAARLCADPLLQEVVQPPGGGAPIPVAEGRLPEDPQADPLFGARIQKALEIVAAAAGRGANRAPAQRCDHFVAGRGETAEPLPTSYLPGLTPVDFGALLPQGLVRRLREGLQEFEKRMPGYAGPSGQLVGVETRTSSPLRLPRDDETLESTTLSGLLPIGEGAGFAGGIVSAALDGRRAGLALAARLGAITTEER
ncbi:MAG TPA: NAD(P)/FAD-dependent oxidoreductase [Planctomycetota bacterium]